jgi:hypothetical protein
MKKYINEIIGIPLAILIFWFSPVALRWLDPTAGIYDAGVLQSLSVAAIYVLCINTAAWLGVRVVFPFVFNYFNNPLGFNLDYKALDEWQKIRLSLCLYCFFVAAYLVALLSI